MNIRAVIFDVYGTLLEMGSPVSNAEAQWQELCLDLLHTRPQLSHLEFCAACSEVVLRRQAAARARGIAHPEFCWPSVVRAVAPGLARLPASKQEEFVYRQIRTGHTSRLAPGAAELLREFEATPLLLGIASNAQAYSIRELYEALAEHDLDLQLFEPDLRFWSFEHGFKKPEPHVFQILSARLEARGIRAAETLMVGDRPDNDIEPARAHGWQTWLLGPEEAPGKNAGGWSALSHRLRAASLERVS